MSAASAAVAPEDPTEKPSGEDIVKTSELEHEDDVSDFDKENESNPYRDPFVAKRSEEERASKFRTVTVGPYNLLKEGQMVQIAISDKNNEEVFRATDKIILLKHKD